MVRKGPKVGHNAPKDDSCTVSRLPRLPKTTVAQFARSQRVPKGPQVGQNAPKDDSCTVSKVYKGQLKQLGNSDSSSREASCTILYIDVLSE